VFLTVDRSGYNQAGEQVCHGLFLCIFNKEAGGELRCIVRHARLVQCGHWMMTRVKVGSELVTISGDYGGDGLPIATHHGETEKLWDQLHIVPDDLTKAFWAGGGHNCAGTEAEAMRKWATANIDALRKLRTK
jgi:hypothetical protein